MKFEDDILIVDDEIPNLRLLSVLLEKEGYQVRPAAKAQTALESALAKPPGLVLLDVRMPEMDGFELCRRLKQDIRLQHVPIIFISALRDTKAKIQGFEAGGVDFISKPYHEQEVLARVKTHMTLHRMQQHLEQLVDERTAEATESKMRFHSLVENANETIVVTQDEAVKYCNPKITELTGYSQEEMQSRGFDAFIHPGDLERVMREYRAKLSGEQATSSYSIRIITRDGQEKHVFVNSTLVDWNNKPATLAMLTDITEQVRMREELKESEERFRRLMEQSPLAIEILTPEGQISKVNDAWMRLWGINEEESAQVLEQYNMLTDQQIKDHGILPQVEKAFAGHAVVLPAFQYEGNRAAEEIGLPHIEGRSPWIQCHLYAVKNAKGEIEHVVNTYVDVTERKEAELNYRTVADFTYDWEYWVNLDGAFKYVSPSCERISGYSAQVFIDNPSLLREIVVPVDVVIWDKHFCDSRKDLIASEVIFRIHRRDGETRWIEHVCQPVTDDKGRSIGFRASNRDVTARKTSEIELRGSYAEVEKLKNQLEAESAYLQDEIKLEHNFENIIGRSESLKYVLNRIEQVAPMDSPVLIMGETGTGKELMARALHSLSPHGKRALVKVNCAALPGELIESELFGREKGAFTGATTTQHGRFELAKGSTLFLDEIGELPFELQAKLLRVLESGEFERLGSSRTLQSDARIIAATNRVLEEEVRKGRFREDLWYRLKVFPITVPPLRERPEDIPLLVKWFVDQLAKKMGKRVGEIPKRTMQMLQSYPWPGNVRELKHAIESALISTRGKKLNFELPKIADTTPSDFKPFEEMERDYILQVLEAKDWKIGGENSAASTLGMHVNTLRGRMKKLGIKKPASR